MALLQSRCWVICRCDPRLDRCRDFCKEIAGADGHLAVKPSQRVSREKIASLLWSSTGPDQARQSLRQTLSTLRKELTQLSPDAKILIEENDLLGLDDSLVECDVADFEPLVAAGTEESLAKASQLYRGDLLDGFLINEERFDQWVIAGARPAASHGASRARATARAAIAARAVR